MINRIVAEIKYTSIYECAACGQRKVGSTKHVSFDGGSSVELKAFVDGQQQRSFQMPVGWSYNGKFSCDGCITK